MKHWLITYVDGSSRVVLAVDGAGALRVGSVISLSPVRLVARHGGP